MHSHDLIRENCKHWPPAIGDTVKARFNGEIYEGKILFMHGRYKFILRLLYVCSHQNVVLLINSNLALHGINESFFKV